MPAPGTSKLKLVELSLGGPEIVIVAPPLLVALSTATPEDDSLIVLSVSGNSVLMTGNDGVPSKSGPPGVANTGEAGDEPSLAAAGVAIVGGLAVTAFASGAD